MHNGVRASDIPGVRWRKSRHSAAGNCVELAKLAPGGDVAQNALMCLVAPIRALPLAKGGLAVEYTWGPAKVNAGAPL